MTENYYYGLALNSMGQLNCFPRFKNTGALADHKQKAPILVTLHFLWTTKSENISLTKYPEGYQNIKLYRCSTT